MSFKKTQAVSGPYLYSNYAKWVAIILTVIGMVVAAVGWAANEHLSIKDFAMDQSINAKREAMEISKDYFVPKEEFSEVRARQEYLIREVDKMGSKINDIHNLLIE